MTEEEILAHAESLANQWHDKPREDEFEEAERTVREWLADGATYSEENGWEF